MKPKNQIFIKLFRWTVIVVVVSVAIAGLITSGSPGNERARRLDDARINLLEDLSRGIDRYWNMNKTLPKTLEQLLEERNVAIDSIQDPETGQQFEYNRTGETDYKLCTIFSAESRDKNIPSKYGSLFWKHDRGRTCFTFEVRKAIDTPPVIIR